MGRGEWGAGIKPDTAKVHGIGPSSQRPIVVTEWPNGTGQWAVRSGCAPQLTCQSKFTRHPRNVDRSGGVKPTTNLKPSPPRRQNGPR